MADIDVWLSVFVVGYSCIVALLIIHDFPLLRKMGRGLLALGCFGIVYGFYLFSLNGIVDQPRAPLFWIDSFKPKLLGLQSTLFFLAGCLLLRSAFQSNVVSKKAPLKIGNSRSSYGFASRFIHWVTAIIFVASVLIGIATSMVPIEASFRAEFYKVHKTLGVIVILLTVARLVWHRLSPTPQLVLGNRRWARRLAAAVHATLYFLLFSVPISGYVMTTYEGYPTYFFWLELQPLWTANEDAAVSWSILHKYGLHAAIYLALVLHLGGAFKHHLRSGVPSSLKRMISS